jgi:acyl-CoA thioesterase
MRVLEDALTLRPDGDGKWLANADPQYEAVAGMFGGWTAAILLRAALDSPSRQGTPSALTINYVAKVEPGTEVAVRTRRVGGGRSIQHWQAALVAVDDIERTLAHAMLIFAERREADSFTEPPMPNVPSPDALDERHPPGAYGETDIGS